MNNDLISREALNKALTQLVKSVDDCYEYGPTDFRKIIDNAPTVAKDYDTGYQDGLEDGLNDIRPQGEWIKEYKDFKCSLCGKIAYSWNDHGTYIQIKSDFCPNCGADMRGGADNDVSKR